MRIIRIAQEITHTETSDAQFIGSIFAKLSTDVAHYKYPDLNGKIIDYSLIDEILKRHPSLINLIKQNWLKLIQDNRSYLYKFVYPISLKNDADIKKITQKLILEMYSNGMTLLVAEMLKYDETDQIFSESNKSLGDAFYDYVAKYPECYKKDKPKALAELPEDLVRETAMDGFAKKLTISNRFSAIESYEKLPPELKTENAITKMEKFLVDLIFTEPYLYETNCPTDFKSNEKILSARETGWINLLNQKSPLIYTRLPKDLKQKEDFLKYKEPAKKILIEKLTHPIKETDSSVSIYVNELIKEFKYDEEVEQIAKNFILNYYSEYANQSVKQNKLILDMMEEFKDSDWEISVLYDNLKEKDDLS